MLMKNKSIIYLTVLLAFVSVMLIFMPAIAKQEQNNPLQSPLNKEGKVALANDDKEDVLKMMKVLADKEKELNKREDDLKKEEDRLSMLKTSLELSLKEYSAMRNKLQKELVTNSNKNGQPQQGIEHIVKIYESMSPEDAAQRIEKMDNNMAVELLSKIKSKQAGKILGAISADKAANLSQKIALGNRKNDR